MAQGITITSPLGPGKMIFRSLDGIEEVGRPFHYRLHFYSPDAALNLDDLIGKPITITMEFEEAPTRYFHAYVFECTQHTRSEGRIFGYEAVLRPQMWMLSMSSDCRVFQQKKAPEIIKEVLDKHGIGLRQSLSRTYEPRDYCVQYCETDLAFISRLMEFEGIYYFFEHASGKHTMVMADSISAHSTLPGPDEIPYLPPRDGYVGDYIFDWRLSKQMRSATYVHTDYDFEMPKKKLESKSKSQLSTSSPKLELYYYPGSYIETRVGEQFARNRLEEGEVPYEVARGKTNSRHFTAGGIFKLADYPRSDQNREHLIIGVHLKIEQEIDMASSLGQLSEISVNYAHEFSAISSRRSFRSNSVTPRPVVKGPHTAVVVGKSGEEIWTDKYGRVKVQFHWDRYGKMDENSSCWVRVSQLWAGKTWGGMQIPRIGQEVIVEFLDGDPDCPIITGRVYNGVNTVPYTLPDNQTQSGVKSQSTKEGSAETFNELRFEDKKGSEEIYFHAEKDFNRIVENNDTLKVGFEKKDAGDQTIDIYNNRTTTLDQGHEKLQVKKGDRTVLVDTGNDLHQVAKGNRDVKVDTGNDSHEIAKGNRTVAVKTGNDKHTIDTGNREVTIKTGNDTLTISTGNQTISIGSGGCKMEAATSIELIVGGSSVKITPSSIEIKSVNIKIEASGQADLKGAMTNVKGDGMVVINGGVVKIN